MQKRDVVVLQLMNGDNVICELDNKIIENNFKMYNPMSITLDPMGGGVGMIPYQALFIKEAKKEAEIHISKVIDVIDEELLNPELIDGYKNYLNEGEVK